MTPPSRRSEDGSRQHEDDDDDDSYQHHDRRRPPQERSYGDDSAAAAAAAAAADLYDYGQTEGDTVTASATGALDFGVDISMRGTPPSSDNNASCAQQQQLPVYQQRRERASRSEHLSVRVRRRGLLYQPSGRSLSDGTAPSGAGGAVDFAVRSVRRETDEWRGIISLFVADLAFKSVVYKPFLRTVKFRPYTCHAAVLFVDLSGYSRITSAVAHKGAHYLSSVVNAYFSEILTIVREHGGDVVKFAGDAVMVVWESSDEADLEKNFLCAALCALDLQQKAPSHTVLEAVGSCPELGFRIHCGITCGVLESEVFVAPVHEHMQRLYHAIGGETMDVIGMIVNAAKPGEIAVDVSCLPYLKNRGTVREAPGCDIARILIGIESDPTVAEVRESYLETLLTERLQVRDGQIEEGFIHPRVVRQLSHGGMSPTQIAQMRSLCVLFIAMTSSGSAVNWLMVKKIVIILGHFYLLSTLPYSHFPICAFIVSIQEVQSVLDTKRCPIVQIIDDDKGVHIVAAINLYETVPEVSMLGLQVCEELKSRRVGCAIGMALGTTFCGVTGSSSVACRWDVTGPAVVRAARLMEFAQKHKMEEAVDYSVYTDRMCSFFLRQCHNNISLKGSTDPCTVYAIKGSYVHSAFRVLETVYGRCHEGPVDEVLNWICGDRSRCAVVVKGPALAGKKIVCQQAAGKANLVPFLHVSDPSWGFLQLARTMATWYTNVNSARVSSMARDVLVHLNKNRWSCAHDECVNVVRASLEEGFRACFVVDRIQFLDEFSMSLIRMCLYGRAGVQRESGLRGTSVEISDLSEFSKETSFCTTGGKCVFLCVHVDFYGRKTPTDIVQEIERSKKSLRVPIIEVGVASNESLRTMIEDVIDITVEDRWLRTFAESSGNCAGYFVERTTASRNLSGKLWKEGKPGLAVTTEDIVLHIPPGYVRKNKAIKVMTVSADAAMRFAHIYDELPPLFQTLSKVLGCACRKGFYSVPVTILWEVLNDLIAEGVDRETMVTVVEEMKSTYLLKVERDAVIGDMLSFLNPALGDTAMDVCTPIQVRTIVNALIERLDPVVSTDFRIPFVLADLHLQLGKNEDLQQELWRKGYLAFRSESASWCKEDVDRWKEIIEDEIVDAGYSVQDILGDEYTPPNFWKPPVVKTLPLLKIYSAPIAFGPMGHSLSLVCRNTFHELKIFHGATDEFANRLIQERKSGAERYVREMEVVESYLTEHSIEAPAGELELEKEMILGVATPATSGQEVVAKAETILTKFVPQFVKPRLERLRRLVTKLREERGIPSVVQNAEKAILCAYEKLYSFPEGDDDAAQHAILIMATLNWKPKPLPEFLPIYHYQTVARIRDKVLKRLMLGEGIFSLHPQIVKDLEAFLVVTPLLYAAAQKWIEAPMD